jgi:hypothetical protein
MPAISAIAAITGAPWRPWQRWVAGHTEEESQVDQQFSVIGKSSAVSLIAALLLVIYTGIRAPTGAMLVWLACLLATVMFFETDSRQLATGALGRYAHLDSHVHGISVGLVHLGFRCSQKL